MQSLKKLANKAASSMIYNDDVSSNAQEEIWNLTNTIQHQKLHLMELEENVGALTQENTWLQEEISHLKTQVMELELMILGYSSR